MKTILLGLSAVAVLIALPAAAEPLHSHHHAPVVRHHHRVVHHHHVRRHHR